MRVIFSQLVHYPFSDVHFYSFIQNLLPFKMTVKSLHYLICFELGGNAIKMIGNAIKICGWNADDRWIYNKFSCIAFPQ
jgi:hypothetical protein